MSTSPGQEGYGRDSGANARFEADWTLLWLHVFVDVPGISGTSHGSQTHWSLEPRLAIKRSFWHTIKDAFKDEQEQTANTKYFKYMHVHM